MSRAPFGRRQFITTGAAAAALLLSGRAFAQSSDPTDLSIAEASRLIRAGALSPVDLVGRMSSASVAWTAASIPLSR